MMNATSDIDQIDRILAGSVDAFNDLIEGHKRLVYNVVYRLVRNETDREDLCQEVFIRVYKHLRDFNRKSKLSTWIATIAYNMSINYLRKKKVQLYEDMSGEGETIDTVATSLSAPDVDAIAGDTSALLQTEIQRLPPALQAVLTLYHLEEFSYVEISQIMDMPDGTVKSYLFRARKMLRDRLVQKYGKKGLLL
jgi:RNA polymerase sigma-70 factor (ECF subfamily)